MAQVSNATLSKPAVCMEVQAGEKKRKAESPAEDKTTKIFKKAKTSHANDSDDELPSMDCNVRLFTKKAPTEVEAMTIPCLDKKGQPKNIKGSTLIETVHDIIQRWYMDVIEYACEYERDIGTTLISPPSVTNSDVISIRAPRDWLMSMGGWKGMAPQKEVRDYFFFFSKGRKFTGATLFNNGLTFPIQDHRIHIPKGFSIHKFDVTTAWEKRDNEWRKVVGGRTDLSYPQIIKAIDHIKRSFGLSDAAIATIQLAAFSHILEMPKGIWGKTAQENQKEIEQFLDYLNALMFGVEASGLNAAFLISFMTLDLIADGKLNYQTAFKANEDGGVYPYACFGNNKGSYNEREKILLHAQDNRNSLSMKAFRETPALSPVANKEAILIKRWLACNDVVDPNARYDDQVENIWQAIQDLFTHYFVPWSTPRFLKKFAKEATDKKE